MNTGAAAMSYVMISELRKRYPDCNITMAIDYGDGRSFENLFCDILYLNSDSMKLLSHRLPLTRYYKAIAKKILGREDAFSQARRFKELTEKCDAAFDISGYILSSQWDVNGNLEKLGQMNVILDNNVPYYIMPQSFGPFNYGEQSECIKSLIKNTLSRCKVVYTREQEGYHLLKDELRLQNVYYSPDMVLQSKEMNWKVILNDGYGATAEISVPPHSVAVIPNLRILYMNDDEIVIDIYSAIINELRNLNKTVFLISHSAEDMVFCQKIKNYYPQHDVHLIDQTMDSMSFENVIEKMEFAVASRFHSIVHAYKKTVPCLILGWAVKYRELAGLLEQEEYVFDVNEMGSVETMISALRQLNQRQADEKTTIRNRLIEIQKSNCFDTLDF